MLLDFLVEGAIIALGRMGKPVAAMAMIESRLCEANRSMNRPVFLFRRAECFLLMDNAFRGPQPYWKKLAAAFFGIRSVTLGYDEAGVSTTISQVDKTNQSGESPSSCRDRS